MRGTRNCHDNLFCFTIVRNSRDIGTSTVDLNVMNTLILLIGIIVNNGNWITDHIGVSVEHTFDGKRAGLPCSYDERTREMRIGIAFKTPELATINSANGKAAATANNEDDSPCHNVFTKGHTLAKQHVKDNVAND